MGSGSEIILDADGLWTNPNELQVPKGAMVRANNLVGVRPGLLEARRGFQNFSVSIGGRVNEMCEYQGGLVAHYGVDQLARFDATGEKTNYAGSYVPPSGNRMRMVVDQGNLYFTTSKGMYVLESLTGTPKPAGVVAPVWMTDPVVNTNYNWLPQDYTVGYRAIIGYVNPHGRQILSAPSDVRQFTNPDSALRGVTVGFGGVGALTTGHFVQIGRTRSTPNSAPGDEYYVVLERFLTSSEAALGVITFHDSVPDELLGDPFYTNPSQESMLQSNTIPPLAKTICPFASSMVFANCKDVHRKLVRLLSPPRDGDTITIDGIVYTARATPVSTYDYQTVTTGSVSQRIRNSAFNLCKHVNGGNAAPRGNMLARYVSGTFDAPGMIAFERPDVSYAAFSLTADSPTLTKSSVTRSGTTVTANFATNHGLQVGDQILVTSNDANYPSGTKSIVTVPDADTVTYTESGTTTAHSGTYTAKRTNPLAGELFNPQLPASGTAIISSDDTALNRVVLSKPNSPESAPLGNQNPIGTLSNDCLQVARLASSLFIFKKTEGLWKATGDAFAGLNISLFDSTVELVSPETVCTLDNTIFCLTRKGVVRISEAGVSEPISLAVEDQILSLYGTALDTVKAVAHAEAYESEGLYILYLPALPGDLYAKQAFVYSVRSGSWTRWNKPASCVFVNASQDKLYLGTGTEGVSVERKLRNASDHQDEDGSAIRIEAQWHPITGGSPATLKRWEELQIFLQDDSTNELFISYGTDVTVTVLPLAVRLPVSLDGGSGQGGDVTLTSSGIETGAIRVPVPTDRCRSGRINIGITHEAAGEKFSCAGIAMKLRGVSSRSKK